MTMDSAESRPVWVSLQADPATDRAAGSQAHSVPAVGDLLFHQ